MQHEAIILGVFLVVILLVVIFVPHIDGFADRASPYTSADSYSANLLDSKTAPACSRVSGFSGDGTFCSPSVPEAPLDIFSQAKGSLSCSGSGYSNAGGSLCLTPDMATLLKTRGGNASGVSSTNGQSDSIIA